MIAKAPPQTLMAAVPIGISGVALQASAPPVLSPPIITNEECAELYSGQRKHKRKRSRYSVFMEHCRDHAMLYAINDPDIRT